MNGSSPARPPKYKSGPATSRSLSIRKHSAEPLLPLYGESENGRVAAREGEKMSAVVEDREGAIRASEWRAHDSDYRRRELYRSAERERHLDDRSVRGAIEDRAPIGAPARTFPARDRHA